MTNQEFFADYAQFKADAENAGHNYIAEILVKLYLAKALKEIKTGIDGMHEDVTVIREEMNSLYSQGVDIETAIDNLNPDYKR